MQTRFTPCPDGLLPDGESCPRCTGPRAASGVNGGSWVHFPAIPLDFRGLPLEIGAKVVFNLSGEMAIGKIISYQRKKPPRYMYSGYIPPYTFKVEVLESRRHSPGHISKVGRQYNMMLLC